MIDAHLKDHYDAPGALIIGTSLQIAFWCGLLIFILCIVTGFFAVHKRHKIAIPFDPETSQEIQKGMENEAPSQREKMEGKHESA
jgi:hypothetical protein